MYRENKPSMSKGIGVIVMADFVSARWFFAHDPSVFKEVAILDKSAGA
jgi:hypothetical protein